MPPATGNSALPVKPAPCLPELPIGREELTVILNKSAANAVENATRMSVPQSEKAVLREMAREQPLPDYKDGWNEKKVITAIQKAKCEGKIILPEEYLEDSYILKHIDEFKNDGVAYLVPKKNLDKYGRDILGWPDGTQFIMKKTDLDKIINSANGDISYIEKCLGIPKDAWKNEIIVKIEITDCKIINLRVPSGFEMGANELWKVGGFLLSGYKEAVCDNILIGNYKEIELWK